MKHSLRVIEAKRSVFYIGEGEATAAQQQEAYKKQKKPKKKGGGTAAKIKSQEA